MIDPKARAAYEKAILWKRIPCPKWGEQGHSWWPTKGLLFWRRYRFCSGCGKQERVK